MRVFGTSTTGTPYVEGQASATENVTLLQTNLPPHAHPYAPAVNNANATVNDPTGAIPAIVNDGTGRDAAQYPGYTTNASTGNALAQQTGVVGQGLPVTNMQPYLVINYIIALSGIYPSRG